MRKRTNFQSIEICKKRWLEDKAITRGFINGEVITFIKDTLELEQRDKMSLQDLRDFSVMYLTQDKKYLQENPEQDVKLWDCMSAITCVIDEIIH